MNWSAWVAGEVPAEVVTVTSTVPVPAGLVAVSSVGETKPTSAAAFGPKCTPAPAVNPVPEILTRVLPAAGPLPGLTPVTAGAVGVTV